MIKKPTLLVLLCAIILGGVVFYLNKKNDATKSADDALKPAFSVDSSNVTSLTIARPASPDNAATKIVKQYDAWQIVQPMETGADSTSIKAILDELATARVSETESGAPDRLKAYGLDPPQISLDFQVQNGAKHSLLMGQTDFSGESNYAIVDGSKSVSLLPKSLYTSLDKSFDDLRDHAVLHITAANVSSFELKNSGGDIALNDSKLVGSWNFTKPADSPADRDAVNSLLGAIENAKTLGIVSEKPDDLGKYGLSSPAVTFNSTDDKSGKSALVIGKKDGDAYFARDLARPQIFKVDADLYKKLGQTNADLRDKKVALFDQQQVVRIELQNANGTVVLIHKEGAEDEWTFDSPADQKGKPATGWKVLSPMDALTADEVLDHPPGNITAMFAKPAVQVILTDTKGKTLSLQISKESGDFVYARTSANPAVYKLKKQALQDLKLRATDLAP